MLQPGLLTLSNVDPHLSFKNHLVSVGKASLHMRVLVLKQIWRCSYVQNDQFFFFVCLVFLAHANLFFMNYYWYRKCHFQSKMYLTVFQTLRLKSRYLGSHLGTQQKVYSGFWELIIICLSYWLQPKFSGAQMSALCSISQVGVQWGLWYIMLSAKWRL